MRTKRQRLYFGLHLATAILVLITTVALTLANMLPIDSRLLGHVSSDKPPIYPGLWIMGDDYGWPWVYRTESFKTEDIAIDVFDEFSWLELGKNAIAGLAIVVALSVATEFFLRITKSRKMCQEQSSGFSRQ